MQPSQFKYPYVRLILVDGARVSHPVQNWLMQVEFPISNPVNNFIRGTPFQTVSFHGK